MSLLFQDKAVNFQGDNELSRYIAKNILSYNQRQPSRLALADISQAQNICSQVIAATLSGNPSLSKKQLAELNNMEQEELAVLLSSMPQLFAHVQKEDDENTQYSTPFLEHNEHLFMTRYMKAQQYILSKLRAINLHHSVNQKTIKHTQNLADILLPLHEKLSPSQQPILAQITAKESGVTVILGGAGSGKSWASSYILKTIKAANPQLLITLCAPTGKAVSRLANEFTDSGDIEIQTIHKLLNLGIASKKAQYHEDNLLAYEFILIDEASMIDMELLAKLLEAIRHDCKVIIVGDSSQLAPVGISGGLSFIQHNFSDNVVNLVEQHRFSEHSEIYHLAQLALKGELLNNREFSLSMSDEEQEALLEQWITAHFHPYYQQKKYALLLDSIVLSPWRNYENGILNLNKFIQKKLHYLGLIDEAEKPCQGLPIVVRSNHTQLEIYNGDKAYLQEINEQLHAVFPDKKNRQIALSTLHNYEISFAMTVHQVQGSEIDNVLLWLGNIDSIALRWLTNNLLYTSITRAKKSIRICGNINDDPT